MIERIKFLIVSLRKQTVDLRTENKELRRMIQTDKKRFDAEDGVYMDDSNALKTG